MTPEQLREEVANLVDKGDEKALENYILQHFAELPEEIQGKALLGFVKEALEKNEFDQKITDLQEQSIAALDELSKIKSELEQK